MYSIQRTDYGFKLVFEGFIQKDEMEKWVAESKENLDNVVGNFFVFIDMRSLKPLPEESQAAMEEGQKAYKAKGMQRSVVILNNPTTTMQFKRIARETGIYQWERYIDASSVPDWEGKGLMWLKEGIDPDKK